MYGKCEECGFEGDCINTDNGLCAECDEDIRQCELCKFPCRTPQEFEKARIKRENRLP